MLLGGKRLYNMTDEAGFGALTQHWISVFGP
jgi:hypothetical protein